MKTKVQVITKNQLNELFNEYINDFYKNADEIWIGLKGTTSLMVVMESNNLYLYDFGVTVQELRKDPIFFNALFTDADVNHALDEHNNQDPQYIYNIFNWYNGFNLVLPCSPCGLVNFIDSYK